MKFCLASLVAISAAGLGTAFVPTSMFRYGKRK